MIGRATTGRRRRHGVAAVELAVLLVPLLVCFLSIVELGRMIQVAQVMTNAARAARMAAQGVTVQVLGNFRYVYTKPANYAATPTPDGSPVDPLYLTDIVADYLTAAGITNNTTISTITVDFVYLTGNTARTDPYQGVKTDRFKLSVSLPYDTFRWTNIGWFNVGGLQESVTWQMVADEGYSVNFNIPQ